LEPFGAKMSPKWGQKLIGKMTSKKGGSREVRAVPGWAELGSQKDQLSKRFGYLEERMAG
jgi:hypothetical protein